MKFIKNPRVNKKSLAIQLDIHRNTAARLYKEILTALKIKGRTYLRQSDVNTYFCCNTDN